MRRAYLAGDRSYDGVFFLGVRTTHVFCRPSCAARKPLPRNVVYFATAADAQRAGFRPCKRCRPLETDGRPPAWVGHLMQRLDTATRRLSDDDLRTLNIDPSRARRYFRRTFGMTFQAYQRARRLGTALHAIQRGADLTSVAYDHGYESTSGFRSAFEQAFGDPPGRARTARHVVSSVLESPIGPLLVCATDQAILRLEFPEPRPSTQFSRLRTLYETLTPGLTEPLRLLRDELQRYFAGSLRSFTVPLEYRDGTPFQQDCWRALLDIPYGQTRSYEDIAHAVGRPAAQRAVGMANHNNRIAIVIPCHRVVNKSGQLGGYGGGLWRKQFLLDLERRVHA